MGCFYHSKVEATGACRRCMIPICDECSRERYCPECHKMAMYMRQGYSGSRQPNLVAQDNERRASLTRQLMINRLARNVLDDLSSSQSPSSRGSSRAPRRRSAKKHPKPVAPVAASVLALVAAFSLGTVFSRPPAQAVAGARAGSAAIASVADVQDRAEATSDTLAALDSPGEAMAARAYDDAGDSSEPGHAAKAHRPAISYAAVPENRLVAQDSAMERPASRDVRTGAAPDGFAPTGAVPGLPRAATRAPGQRGRAVLQALVAQAQPPQTVPGEEALVPELPAAPVDFPALRPPAAPPQSTRGQAAANHADARPAVAVSWPVAGNTLRMTSYVKVRVTNPDRVSVLDVTVDGKPFAPVHEIAARTEIPVDTTRLPNGDHRLQVMAMTESGDIITSEAVPITVLN